MQNHKNELQRSMKSRHLFMIALGGVIGTGLFLGSGFTISKGGTARRHCCVYHRRIFNVSRHALFRRIGCCHAGGRIVSGLRH